MVAGMLDQEDWRCPVCCDLIFKPAVNSACGHVYCFWCLHKAMSPYTPSACPICRTKYGHLPAICAKLHRFLSCQFPEAYSQRRTETEAEERESGGAAPEPDAGPLPPPPAPSQWQPQHWACDNPGCGRLLWQPVVLTCGHVVCGPCLPSEAAGAAAGAAAAATGNSSTSSGSSSSSARCECPACGMASPQLPAVCKQLGDLLLLLLPEESKQRQQECEQALHEQQQQQLQRRRQQQAAEATTADNSCTGSSIQHQQQQGAAPAAAGAAGAAAAGEDEEEPTTPRSGPATAAEAAGSSEAAAASGAGGDGTALPTTATEQQGQQQQTLSPSLVTALRRRQAAGGPGQAMAERLEESLRKLTGEGYVHHGVGCDGCGLYPIQGRRYQCQDCPEAMGFDLCGACMDRGQEAHIVGRFNQRHTPDHRMTLKRPRVTAMHMLQAANPELPLEQLMWLLELSIAGGDDEQQQQQPGQAAAGATAAAASDAAPPGGAPAAAPQVAAAAPVVAAGESGGDAPIPVLRRGPRPAYAPSAQEPSPSAYAAPPERSWGAVGPAAAATATATAAPAPGQQQAAAAAGSLPEAHGLIDDAEDDAAGAEGEAEQAGEEEEEPAGTTAVHVSLDDLLGSGGGGRWG